MITLSDIAFALCVSPHAKLFDDFGGEILAKLFGPFCPFSVPQQQSASCSCTNTRHLSLFISTFVALFSHAQATVSNLLILAGLMADLGNVHRTNIEMLSFRFKQCVSFYDQRFTDLISLVLKEDFAPPPSARLAVLFARFFRWHTFLNRKNCDTTLSTKFDLLLGYLSSIYDASDHVVGDTFTTTIADGLIHHVFACYSSRWEELVKCLVGSLQNNQPFFKMYIPVRIHTLDRRLV